MDEVNETNEWLSLSHSETIADVVSQFRTESKEFLFPKKGETYNIRLLGKGLPYYRTYMDQRIRWRLYLNPEEIRGCLKGNKKAIFTLIKRLVEKNSSVKNIVSFSEDYVHISFATNPSWETKEIMDVITFLQKCLSEATLWSQCVIFNAYVKGGTKMIGCVKPTVISRPMIYGMLKENTEQIDINSSNISGVNAYDLTLDRIKVTDFYSYTTPTQVPVTLRISSKRTILDMEDVISISRQGLYDIPKFVKANNDDSLMTGGFIHKPSEENRDLFATSRFVEDAIGKQIEEWESEQSSTESELCNLPPKLRETDFRGGPISGIEIL